MVTYQVQANETVTGISRKSIISAQVQILWENPYTLSDNPHDLIAGMTLNILPVDGVYYDMA